MELEDFIKRVDAFALERDWAQFHSVRNLVLAMVGEVGELAEVFQWVSDDQKSVTVNSAQKPYFAWHYSNQFKL